MHVPASPEREQQILALWERGTGLGRWARDEALLATMGATPQALGARNAMLLALRGTLFDRAWPLRSRCPGCNADCEFEVDCVALAEELSATSSVARSSMAIEWAGQPIELRAPTALDMQAVGETLDAGRAARALLARCMSGDLLPDALDDRAVDELDSHLERLDPAAVVSFALQCPSCNQSWSAAVDVGEAVWAELRRAAERSLIEVDVLARTYGWTEGDVLRLSPMRRAAYLQLVGAA
jgi:hypothetical protein